MHRLTPLLVLCLLAWAQAAMAQTRFEARCEALAAEARIQVVFEDKPVTRDNSRSLDELKRLAQSGRTPVGTNPYHRVLGLTHAEPSTWLDLSARALDNGAGKACAVPLLTVTLSFAQLQVYVARDITSACRRRIIEDHENEHVAAWRNHLRIGARLLTPVLQKSLAQPMYFDPSVDVQAVLQLHVESVVHAQLVRLMAGIEAAHQAIDAPSAYQLEENRLRACP